MSEGALVTEGPHLVVAGAGGGLVAALRAAQFGLRVLVLESSPHFQHGNNTSMSTAMIPGAGTRWQEDVGVQDSAERFIEDIVAKTHGEADRVLARALASVSARLVTWLADDIGLPLELATDFDYPGHSRLRCHTVPGRTGSLLVSTLVQQVESSPLIDMLVPARLVDVEVRGGAVAGVEISYPDGAVEYVPTPAVLLATNGFGGDADLVRRYIPEIAGAVYHGSAESRGDALRIGTHLGAEAAFLDAYQGHGALSSPHGTLVGWATVMHGGVLVNNAGQRFGDETVGYSEFARRVIAEPGGTAVLVLDGAIRDACRRFDDFRQTEEAGALRWADTSDELAGAFGIDPAGLRTTLTGTRAFALGHAADPLGRVSWRHPLDTPLAGVRVTGALFHTQGGLRVDGSARVLRPDRTPVRGLYAAGGAAIGISGHGPAGYLAGNGLLPALGLAFLAAEHIAGTQPCC